MLLSCSGPVQDGGNESEKEREETQRKVSEGVRERERETWGQAEQLAGSKGESNVE